ncbi:helix-turn-helix domain-containing protein [Azotobacter vinelandii]
MRYSEFGLPSFCIVLKGSCLLTVDRHEQITISAGDFILLPTTPAFTISSFAPVPPVYLDPNKVVRGSELRYGEQEGSPDMRSLGGSFLFDCSDPGLLVSLLPKVVHVQNSVRLSQLVQMVSEESTGQKAGQRVHAVPVGGIAARGSNALGGGRKRPSGVVARLGGDERMARALKQMHARIDHPWTVDQLAKISALSRSAFYERFTRMVGVAPMEYLLAWRMEIAKDLLRDNGLAVSEVAERVGYGSTSTFSVAFSRHVGQPPSRYARSE